MKKLYLSFFVTLLLSGCATQTYYINGDDNSTTPDKEKQQPFFVHGVGQEQEINAADICGGAENVVKVQSKLKFLDGFLSAITFGIYTPRTAMVYCAKK